MLLENPTRWRWLTLCLVLCLFGSGCRGEDAHPHRETNPEVPTQEVDDPDGGGHEKVPGHPGWPSPQTAPAVILMIGDGMGPAQLRAASYFRHGQPDALFMQSLPHRGLVATASLSGLTDSAAAATTMATGERTYNGRVGLDRHGKPAETLVELAHRLGRRAGVVSTSSLPHATPGSFSAHRMERGAYVDIAWDQAMTTRPDVMLGGGLQYFLPKGPGSVRGDSGLLDPLAQAGFQIVYTGAELSALHAHPDVRVFGAFAPDHLDYVRDRAPHTSQPTLPEMATQALRLLEPSPNGFFLIIEGSRIDMASHLNDVQRTIDETLAFDDAIRVVAEWAKNRPNTTLIVTADHECGGLEAEPAPAGVTPQVRWRWDQHTNAHVDVFAQGAATASLHGQVSDHRLVHAVLASQLRGETVESPSLVRVPDGILSDLRHVATRQKLPSDFGPGLNQLDSLKVDADAFGLWIGVEGLVEWDRNAVVVLIDKDLGHGTGPAQVMGVLKDKKGRLDTTLSSLKIQSPWVTGFGADMALGSIGGAEVRAEELIDSAGLRAWNVSGGANENFSWLKASLNLGQGVRTRASTPPVAEQGLEAFIPWSVLYPELDGRVPPGAEVGLAVALSNESGSYLSNQFLPPLDSPVAPGSSPVRLPGVVRYRIDVDGDGVPDGETPPDVLD